LGRDLLISDLTKSGFGIPYTKINCLKGVMKLPGDNTSVADYLEYAKEILENNLEGVAEESKTIK